MLHQSLPFLDDTKQAIALALYEAGETDTAIGLNVGVPPMNIADWRRRNDLPENKPPLTPQMQAWLKEARSPEIKRQPPSSGQPPKAVMPPSSGPPASAPPAAGPLPPRVVREQAPPPALSLTGTGVQPTGDNALDIGVDGNDTRIFVDLLELLSTRLLVQGNSGSGKSHLLRRLLEECTGVIQQIVIDPEGDFVTLDTFGHMVIDAAAYSRAQLASLGARAREHRISLVLDLSRFEAAKEEDDDEDPILEKQMLAASAFLNALFSAPAEHWHPALVVVDEAQVLAPSNSASLDVDKHARRQSVTAMADIMCRGRKRGLAGILATQRLAKLSANVAGEVSNFLMGRTFFDNDIARAGDMLGLRPAQASQIADLLRGEFMGVGPAIARRPIKVKVGSTITLSPNAGPEIEPLPDVSAEDVRNLLLGDIDAVEDKPNLRLVS